MNELALNTLAAHRFNFDGYRIGQPQRAGALTMLPVFGPTYPETIAPPRTGLKLSRVAGYGRVEIKNPSSSGVAIVPLHMGYIQDHAQNHALCRSAFIAAGQTLMFEDACCVQQSQGGFLQEKEQWFFILPVQLRYEALTLRGQQQYSKLWGAISQLNQQVGLPTRGHLEQIVSRQRAHLTQFQSRLELLPDQLGALFFLEDRLVGIEIAPNPAYFQEVWVALVCFGYGIAAWYSPNLGEQQPFAAATLPELHAALSQSRNDYYEQVKHWLVQTRLESPSVQEEERYRDMRLNTVIGEHFAGQFVADEKKRLVYLSLFARTQN